MLTPAKEKTLRYILTYRYDSRLCQNATGEIFREHTKKSQADFDEQLKLCPKKFKSNLKSMLGVTTVDFCWFTVRWATLQQLLVKTKVQGL